ncbi:MAG: LacI family DNA-binding transcriptional regulator [Terracidiphilus sp.]
MAERTKYTMRDVARLAGVSTSTVSAVINESVIVSPQRKARVMAAMSALDYQPDAIARSLKTGRSNAIGVIVPDITNAFYPEVIRGIELAAQATGYSVLLCDSNEDRTVEERHLSALFSRRVDGVILACCADSRANELIARRHIPVIFIDRLPPSTVINSVCTDNVAAGQLAAEHLIELGHKRIGMLAGHLGLSPHHDRLEGFRKAMQEAHLPILDEYLIEGNVQVEDGVRAGHRLLDLPNPPTAIMASNNKLLLGVLQAVEERNVAIPKDLSVLGFDDYLWNMHFSPSLTAVAQPTAEIGRKSFELLHQLIQDPPTEDAAPMHVLIPAELRIRNSTASL